MPCDPRQPYDLSLTCFAETPPGERPTFSFRRLNGSEFNEIGRLRFDSEAADTESFSRAMFEALAIGLLGWRHCADPASGEEVPFDPVNLPRVLNAQEAIELIDQRLDRGRLSGADRKNSAPQS